MISFLNFERKFQKINSHFKWDFLIVEKLDKEIQHCVKLENCFTKTRFLRSKTLRNTSYIPKIYVNIKILFFSLFITEIFPAHKINTVSRNVMRIQLYENNFWTQNLEAWKAHSVIIIVLVLRHREEKSIRDRFLYNAYYNMTYSTEDGDHLLTLSMIQRPLTRVF